jgi:hypothetical protein
MKNDIRVVQMSFFIRQISNGHILGGKSPNRPCSSRCICARICITKVLYGSRTASFASSSAILISCCNRASTRVAWFCCASRSCCWAERRRATSWGFLELSNGSRGAASVSSCGFRLRRFFSATRWVLFARNSASASGLRWIAA